MVLFHGTKLIFFENVDHDRVTHVQFISKLDTQLASEIDQIKVIVDSHTC
ncbi:MAG: hypothetical protein Q8S84_08130 [bacterium]|nr:hypothetical protein [bacterium]